MNFEFGAYLIVPLKYAYDLEKPCVVGEGIEEYKVDTLDINENIRNMFHDDQVRSIGSIYKIRKEALLSNLPSNGLYTHCSVVDQGISRFFHILDSYLYVFSTKIAFLCLGISYEEMQTLKSICNPGHAVNPAEFAVVTSDGRSINFSMDEWLEGMCQNWQLERFCSSQSSVLLESYAYMLAVSDTAYPSLECMRKITFNVHQMLDPELPGDDDSEEDIRYAYAVKNAALNGYRWGCCITSQTTAYAVADVSGEMEIDRQMQIQAADGLPLTLLALYEKYTCMRFTELIASFKTKQIKEIVKLKKMLLNFQAFGTVMPANLSRWNNIRQIYAYLLEVSQTDSAVQEIRTKIDILVEQQQEIEMARSSRIMNLITIFGVVGIMASVQEIVQILSDGNDLMWNVTVLTMAILAVCFGLAMRKK